MDGKKFWEDLPVMMKNFKLNEYAQDYFNESCEKFGYQEGYVQLFYASVDEIKNWAYQNAFQDGLEYMVSVERKKEEVKDANELYRKVFYPLFECMDDAESKTENLDFDKREKEEDKYLETKLKELYPDMKENNMRNISLSFRNVLYSGIKLPKQITMSFGNITVCR